MGWEGWEGLGQRGSKSNKLQLQRPLMKSERRENNPRDPSLARSVHTWSLARSHLVTVNLPGQQSCDLVAPSHGHLKRLALHTETGSRSRI